MTDGHTGPTKGRAMTTTSRDDRRVPVRTKVEHLPLAERVARGKAAPGPVVTPGHGARPAPDPEILPRLVDLIHAS